MPIGGSKPPNPDEEKPVGGKGGYNLDNLDESAFGGGDAVMTFENKPKKAPPARLANKGKKELPEEKKEEDVEMKDEVVA